VQITARKQRIGTVSLKDVVIGLGIAGTLAAGMVGYVVSSDDGGERVIRSNNIPVIAQPEKVRPTLREGADTIGPEEPVDLLDPTYLMPDTALDARTYDQMLFDEQNWNLDAPAPGRIATTSSARGQQLSWEDAYFLEQNTIFLPSDTVDTPPYADRLTEY
jgi:hypothetical protein